MYEYIFATMLVLLAVLWLAYRLLKKGSGAGGCNCCSLLDKCQPKLSDERQHPPAGDPQASDGPDGEPPAP